MWIVRIDGSLVNLNQFSHVLIMGDKVVGYSNLRESFLYESEDESRLKLMVEYIIERLEGSSLVCDLRVKETWI